MSAPSGLVKVHSVDAGELDLVGGASGHFIRGVQVRVPLRTSPIFLPGYQERIHECDKLWWETE